MCLNGKSKPQRTQRKARTPIQKRVCRSLKRALRITCLRNPSAKALGYRKTFGTRAGNKIGVLPLQGGGLSSNRSRGVARPDASGLAYPWLPSSTPSACKAADCQLHTASRSLPTLLSHSHVIGSAAAFGRNPVDDLIWVHDVAGLAVDAVGEVDLELTARN